MNLGQLWDSLVDCICRPPRDDEYTIDDLVGGATGREKLAGCWVTRKDLVLTNKKGLKLQCSHYIPAAAKGRDGKLPCVIYCHCNSGSRRDAEEALVVLITLGVSVFALDFAGSGLSEGKYVTLGAHEADDVEVVVQHLRSTGTVSTLGLWGRSMGAVTALVYSARDPSIAGMVLDSPFCKLTDLMMEIVEREKLPIPKAFTKMALAAMKRSVRKRAEFDISEVTPLDVVTQSYIPALFGHAPGDTFINIKHSERLFEVYAGDKNMIRVEGDHNSRRPEYFYNSVAIFFHNTLQLDTMLESGGSSKFDGEAMARREAKYNSMASGRKAPGSPRHAAAAAHHHHALGATGVPWELEALRANSVSLRRQTISSSLDGGGLARPSQPNLFPGSTDNGHGDGNSNNTPDSNLQEVLEDAELMEAIRLSLLLEQEKQQQAQQQQQQQAQSQQSKSGTAAAGPLGAAAAAKGVAAAGVGSSGVAAAPQRNGSAASTGASGGAAHISSRRAGLLAPQTPEAEQEQLQRALELSLQERQHLNPGTSNSNVATSSTQPAAPSAAPSTTVNGVPSQQHNYVDLLTAQLGEGLKQTRLT